MNTPSERLITDNGQPITLVARALPSEWLRAFVLALLVLLILHLFVFRFVSVQSTSMFATLRPGDVLLVARWPKWTGLKRGDIVVFRDPLRDDLAQHRRPLLVKRVAAVPGDRLEIRRGRLLINGHAVVEEQTLTRSYLVRLKKEASPVEFLRRLDIPYEAAHGDAPNIELPLNDDLAQKAQADPAVISVAPMRLASGGQRHVFPFSPVYPWNGDNYGPITIPARGDTLHITATNLPLYDRLISAYEGHRLGTDHNTLTIDDAPLKDYVVEEDYYFVLGDSRHFSSDSRYWGFLPAGDVVGRGSVVLMHK